jgi:hypothetical protein
MISFVEIRRPGKGRLLTFCCFAVLLVLSFGYGVAVDRYRIFPYSIVLASYVTAYKARAWAEQRLPWWGDSYMLSSSWIGLSSTRGDLPLPGESDQQTASLVLDVDRDGLNDFVIGARHAAPALVWYRREAATWQRYVIDADRLPIEAGGAFHDIDDDGDLDIVMGEDSSGNKVYWWENPYPKYDPNTGWQRHIIKDSGSNQHHDQAFGDFDGDGTDELAFWNQGAKTLYLAEIPSDPKATQSWPIAPIYEYESGKSEGLAGADVDQDGRIDLVGGGLWFRNEGEGRLVPHVIDDQMRFTRAAAGQLKPGGWSEVVFGAGDEVGRLKWYEWDGQSWLGHDLLDVDVDHGHSLAIADLNQDGNLDVFCAEMHTPGHGEKATSWIFYGDGQGHFAKEVVSTGMGNHESRVADLDGDGDPDILVKPYTWAAPRVDVLLNRSAPLDQWERHVIDPDKGERSIFIAAGDLDADGRQDIITGSWWYRNPGSPGGSWERRSIGEPLANMAAVYDFDQDGDLDILGTEGKGSKANAKLVWARNDGAGSFDVIDNIESGDGDFLQGVAVGHFRAEALQVALSWHAAGKGIQMLTVPAEPSTGQWTIERIQDVSQDEALSVGDIDRSGAPDLLLGTKWLRRDGGAWHEETLGLESLPDRNRLIDMNGDGRLDAVVGFEATSKPGEVVWYEQPEVGTGLWRKHVIATVIGPMSLDVGDLDHDGDVDAVVGEHNLADPSHAKLYVFENRDGRGEDWIAHVVSQGDEHHDGAVLVDIDGDQDLDILSIGWSHNRVLLFENKLELPQKAIGGNDEQAGTRG